MRIQSVLKKHRAVSIAAAAVLAVALLYIFLLRKGNSSNEVIAVRRGEITQEVSVTGKTKPAESVDLAFEKGGRIAWTGVKTGDKAFFGQTLVTLDLNEPNANLGQAEANLESEKAKLAELKRGTRPEEIVIQETKVENAGTALNDARRNMGDKIGDAYTKADDAVRTKADQLFSSPRGSNPQLNHLTGDSQLKLGLERDRPDLETLLVNWRISLDGIADDGDLRVYTNEARNRLNQIQTFLDKLSLAVNSFSASASLSQATIDNYKSDISTARANVNTALANLTAADEKLRTAQSNLNLAQNELALKKAGPTSEEIASQEAKVKQAEANVASAEAQLAKAILKAPISGTIARQDAKAGEIVAANAVLVSIISESNLGVEANIPEVDIGKIKAGNPVKINLDAFPGESFSGKVVRVDPAETIVDGVVNFKVDILFEGVSSRLKSGLTANLTIETLKKSDVLILPQFAIIENDQGTFAKKQEEGKVEEVPVKIGVRGQRGLVEILDGLEENDKVLNIGLKTSGNK
ncbi:MAG: efflux RND transporter periplasmic adaptor subunit [Candidatus Sungbacteria bacterium]|nr:efflux RND transporter periplasmic adaptor subunit [Candidatus Sungbacteria bacterium]